MGKKRFVEKSGDGDVDKKRSLKKMPKKKILKGIVNIEATYNNTRVTFTEENGNPVMWSTSGSVGFKSTRKSTPYAASKVADVIAENAQAIGVKDLDIVIKGVGTGRESALRSFMNRGFEIHRIQDKTPVPHNGPRKKKARKP